MTKDILYQSMSPLAIIVFVGLTQQKGGNYGTTLKNSEHLEKLSKIRFYPNTLTRTQHDTQSELPSNQYLEVRRNLRETLAPRNPCCDIILIEKTASLVSNETRSKCDQDSDTISNIA